MWQEISYVLDQTKYGVFYLPLTGAVEAVTSDLLLTFQLHFARPSAYHEIYNRALRWDKEPVLYRSFGEDRSSFGFLTYREAKERKDVLQPFFSRRAIIAMQGLVQEKVRRHDKSTQLRTCAWQAHITRSYRWINSVKC